MSLSHLWFVYFIFLSAPDCPSVTLSINILIKEKELVYILFYCKNDPPNALTVLAMYSSVIFSLSYFMVKTRRRDEMICAFCMLDNNRRICMLFFFVACMMTTETRLTCRSQHGNGGLVGKRAANMISCADTNSPLCTRRHNSVETQPS